MHHLHCLWDRLKEYGCLQAKGIAWFLLWICFTSKDVYFLLFFFSFSFFPLPQQFLLFYPLPFGIIISAKPQYLLSLALFDHHYYHTTFSCIRKCRTSLQLHSDVHSIFIAKEVSCVSLVTDLKMTMPRMRWNQKFLWNVKMVMAVKNLM